jgi:hypothetical protein
LKDKEQFEFWQKRLAAEPYNIFYQRFASMTSDDQNRTPTKPSEIEDQDPTELGRGGFCHIALEVLLELYPTGQPHKLTSTGKDYAHVFLMFKGQPLDICGTTSMAEMRGHYKNDYLLSEATTVREIQTYFRGWQTPEESKRLKAHFKKHILENQGGKFPFR